MRCSFQCENQNKKRKNKMQKIKFGVQKQVSVSAPSMRLGNMGI